MAHNGGKWGAWSELLAGLPYDVQSRLYYTLSNYQGVNPASCYRLPLLASTQRQAIAPGGQAVDAWRFTTLTAVYGVSGTIENETVGAGGIGVSDLTPVYGSEVGVQIDFNNGSTTFLGTAQEPFFLSSMGDRNHTTRMDPVIAVQNDQWNVTWRGNAALVNGVFSAITLHGVKIYAATGAI
jgi:hypothetical protein